VKLWNATQHRLSLTRLLAANIACSQTAYVTHHFSQWSKHQLSKAKLSLTLHYRKQNIPRF